MIVFEHSVFFIGKMIDIAVPDIPESLKNRKLRLRYLAKQTAFASKQRAGSHKISNFNVQQGTSPNTIRHRLGSKKTEFTMDPQQSRANDQ